VSILDQCKASRARHC